MGHERLRARQIAIERSTSCAREVQCLTGADMEDQASQRLTKWSLALLIVILSGGIFLRVWPSAGFKSVGVDEHQYAVYTEKGVEYGLSNYGRVIDEFIGSQVKQPEALVPATRIGLIWPAAFLARIGTLEPLYALRVISAASAILLLIATAIIGYRFGGTRQMLVVTTLMAVAPLQICLAQRSLSDAYFAFLAVLCAWFFLERLQAPQARGWLIAYGLSFLLLVLTKENAAFVCFALLAIWLCFVFAGIARSNFALLLVTLIAGAIGVMILASLLGGLSEWLTFCRLYARKSTQIPYVVQFQDGAWYRYLIDFTVLSPVIVALVFGRLFKIDKGSRPDLFWALFLGFSFLAMSSVRYGMNLRFAAYWDEPLRWLAASQLVALGERWSVRARNVFLVTALALLVIVDLAQYHRFFVKAEIYDPVSSHLLRASKLVK
jgi:hypothetical protein